MNPTAEDEVVDDAHAHLKANSKAKSNANDTPVPWSEVLFCCARRKLKIWTFSVEL